LDGVVDVDRLKRHDLNDAEWARLAPLLPAHPRQGHRWNDHRLVIDGIFFRTRTGCPWRDLPERFGNWKTVYNRHRRWSGDATWEKILDRLFRRIALPKASCLPLSHIAGDKGDG
jgi:transposase